MAESKPFSIYTWPDSFHINWDWLLFSKAPLQHGSKTHFSFNSSTCQHVSKHTSTNSQHARQFSSKSRKSHSTLKRQPFVVAACEERSWSRNPFLHRSVSLGTPRNPKCCPLLGFVRCHTTAILPRTAGRLGSYLQLVMRLWRMAYSTDKCTMGIVTEWWRMIKYMQTNPGFYIGMNSTTSLMRVV